MERKLNMIVFAIVATVALLQSSVASTTYEVGDSLGWTIPTGGSAAYSTWAANKTFIVGDILAFSFRTGAHDVTQVTKEAYDACNGTNPISMTSTGPANITLQTAGEHYFICSVSGHCISGQKLTINVTGASSPAPQPNSPSPAASTPVPSPALAPEPSSATPSPTSSPSPAPESTATPPSTGGAPSPSGTTTPSSPSPTNVASPPENSGAGSLGVAGLSATFLSIALALWY